MASSSEINHLSQPPVTEGAASRLPWIFIVLAITLGYLSARGGPVDSVSSAPLSSAAAASRTPPQPAVRDHSEAMSWVRRLESARPAGDWQTLRPRAEKIAELGDPVAIPYLIGMLEADYGKDLHFGIYSEALRQLAGVSIHRFHDGAWWKRWWAANKHKFPEDVRQLSIPRYAPPEPQKQSSGLFNGSPKASPRDPGPFPSDLDTTQGLIRYIWTLASKVPSSRMEKLSIESDLQDAAAALCEIEDPRAIPSLIGVMESDNSKETVACIGQRALNNWVHANARVFHDGKWWRRWWEANKGRYPEDVRRLPVPSFTRPASRRSRPALFGDPAKTWEKQYISYPSGLDLNTTQGLVGYLWFLVSRKSTDPFDEAEMQLNLMDAARELGGMKDPRVIPSLIGIIEADNSLDVIRMIGQLALSDLTHVKSHDFRDGGWWRRWWEANKKNYSAEVQAFPIPVYPPTANAKKHSPTPPDIDTFDGLVRYLRAAVAKGALAVSNGAPPNEGLSDITNALAELKDPRAIPVLIGLVDAHNEYATVYFVGYFALRDITGVDYSSAHNGAWWKKWWADHKADYPPEARDYPIADFTKEMNIGRRAKKGVFDLF